MLDTINLLYTCDDEYLPLVSVSLASFVHNNVDLNFKVYIATDKDEYTNNYMKMINFHKNICFSFINCRKYDYLFKEKKLNKWGSNSFYIYWRMIAPEIVECDYLYYIDTDIICFNKIENPLIDNSVCGLVLDSVHSLYNHRLKEENTNLYNTGIMYIDVKKWKEKQCTLRCINFIKNDRRKLLLADQDIISLALKGDICKIDPKYNYYSGYDYYGIKDFYDIYELDKKSYYSKDELEKSKENIIFYHCLGGVYGRPWEINNKNPIRNIYHDYLLKSCWSNYSKQRKKSFLTKLELLTYKFFPREIYKKIHRFALKMYIIKKTLKIIPVFCKED